MRQPRRAKIDQGRGFKRAHEQTIGVIDPTILKPGRVFVVNGTHYFIGRSGTWYRATPEQIDREGRMRMLEQNVPIVPSVQAVP